MSKFQIVKGIIDNLEETPYTEGKVYFTYDNIESQNIAIYADIDGVRRKIKEGVQRDELNNYLLKTDIANWAKASTKPTYTASEVGALPDTTVIPEDKVFIVNYNNTTKTADKTYSEIQTADNNGKIIYLQNSYSKTFYLISSDLGYHFINFNGLRTTDGQGNKLHSFTEYNLNSQNTWTERSWTIPYQLSQFINDSGFQTSSEVNSAIATAIGNINQFNVAIVSTLPTENIDTHTLYFMSNGGSDDSIYDEWMYINNNWEKIGTTAVDLSGYMQTSHPANGITSTDIGNWNKKIDKQFMGYLDSTALYYPIGHSWGSGSSYKTWTFPFVLKTAGAYINKDTPVRAINSTNNYTTLGTIYLNDQKQTGDVYLNYFKLYICTVNDGNTYIRTVTTLSDIPDTSSFLTSETDPVFSASAAAGITNTDINNWNSKTSNTGTVTSIGLTNATDSGLTISGSPITNSGNITVGHSNILSSAQTTQAVYPIKIDKNGHISAYGSAVTITDEKVKQTPLNSKNSIRGLLFSSSPGNSEVTNSVSTSDKIQWNDYDQRLAIYNSDKTKYSYLTDTILSLANNDNSYNGNLQVANLTANRNYSLPDKGGTIALTSDIPNITSTDINNWNAKVSDTGKWNGVALGSGRSDSTSDLWIPSKDNSNNNSGTAYWIKTTQELPTESAVETVQIPRYKKIDNQWYLQSTTPLANDNSTKVATTEYVNNYVKKSGDTMTGSLTFSSGHYIVENDNIIFSIKREENTLLNIPERTITFSTSGLSGSGDSAINRIGFSISPSSQTQQVYLTGIITPTGSSESYNYYAASKGYVDSNIPKVYSSTNTTGYLTMDTLPIYDGTVV